jgi:hypothetical protein
MKKIKFYPSLATKLRNAEHFDLMLYVDTTVPAVGVKPAGLSPAWTTFHLNFEKEDAIYKRAAKREETALIKAAHQRRRDSYLACKRLIEAASYSPASDVKDAADLLLEVLDNYKRVYAAPMNEATALYVNLLQDFARPKHAAAVALIPAAAEAIAQLDADNEAFRTIFYARTEGEEEVKEEGSMRDARKATDKAFATLVDAINVFYQMNEMLGASKDQEVSDTLGKLITDINSYLHMHEEAYARRNPDYHAEKDKPSSPSDPDDPGEPTDPDEPEMPSEPGIPEFSIDAQETLGESAVMPGYGVQMSLRAVDAQAFADMLYPGALGGALRLTWPGTTNSDTFPIADFLFNGATPVGLVVNAPAGWEIYKPFRGSGEVTAEIIKDDVLLAKLLNVEYPAMMGED